MRSPIDGIISTPHVENLTGRKLQRVIPLLEVVDTSRAIVDVSVDDFDAGVLEAAKGQSSS